ncbi:MAG: hypothetical protein ACOX8X_01315 [Methanomethylophilus sp.]|jgi:hypothetical protein
MPLGSVRNCLFCGDGPDGLRKIYCKCGRIVDYDEREYDVKTRLHKQVECPYCRNARISQELDTLDSHFSVIEEEPEFRLFRSEISFDGTEY